MGAGLGHGHYSLPENSSGFKGGQGKIGYVTLALEGRQRLAEFRRFLFVGT